MIRVWPTIRAGIDVFVARFPLMMGAWLIILAIQQAIMLLIPDAAPWGYLQTLVAALVLAPFYAGQQLIALKLIRQEPVSIRNLFSGFPRWGALVIVSLITTLAQFVGGFLLVVPAIVWSLMLVFAPIAVLDARDLRGNPERIGPFGAIRESARLTKGCKGQLFGIALFLGLPLLLFSVLVILGTYVDEFFIAPWLILLLQILGGSLFLGPVSAACYMTVYDKIISLQRSAYEDESGIPTGTDAPEPASEERAIP